MKRSFLISFVLFLFGNFNATIFAQTPQEQFSQMVEQLQKKPDDKALREKIIKLGAEMKPAPVISEEAMRRMARGKAAYKSAKSIEDYQDAIKEYQLAIEQAPWWVDAYFNLGVVQDKAEKYADALQSLKFALISTPEDKEIKNLIYEVEYRNEKANSPQAKADMEKEKAANKIEAVAKQFEGNWSRDVVSGGGDRAHLTLFIKRSADNVWHFDATEFPKDSRMHEIKLVETELQFKRDETFVRTDGTYICATYKYQVSVTNNGDKLRFVQTLLPFSPDRQDNKCPSKTFYGAQYVFEYSK